MKNLNNLEKISKIKKEKINQNEYFKSLISEAYNQNLITQEEINKIHVELLDLLDKRVYRYNGDESTSIRKEIVDQINESNMYTIDVFLKTDSDLEYSLDVIKNNSAIYLYESGIKEIKNIINKSKIIYSQVLKNRIKVNNEIYNDTIIGGIKGFFKIYNFEFNAQDMKITADYPLYNNIIGNYFGIEFIKKYLESIYYENCFCNLFDIQDIKKLLYSYSKEYSKLIFNIFEVVLIQAIGCKLANINIKKLFITNYDIERICLLFKNKSENEITKLIEDSYQKIKIEMFNDNIELDRYINKKFNDIIFIIKNNYKQSNLNNIFIADQII